MLYVLFVCTLVTVAEYQPVWGGGEGVHGCVSVVAGVHGCVCSVSVCEGRGGTYVSVCARARVLCMREHACCVCARTCVCEQEMSVCVRVRVWGRGGAWLCVWWRSCVWCECVCETCVSVCVCERERAGDECT